LKWNSYSKMTIMLLALATVYRLVLIFCFGAGPDESFYWEWTRFDRLDWGYVEHPPLVAYAIYGMSRLFGEHIWSWRILALVLGFLAGWLLFLSGKTLFSDRAGFWAAVTFLISPVFSMAGGMLLIPETLLMFWMSLAIYLSALLVTTQNLKIFYWLGVVFGMALLSKLPAILIVAALGLFALISKPHRRWFSCREPYLMVLLALVMLTPVIYWNVQHDWIGLEFLTQRTELKEDLAPSGTPLVWQSITAQAGYHSPLLFVFLWIGVALGGYQAFFRKDQRYLLLFCFSAPVIVVFQIISSFRFTLPHWPLSGYLAAYVALPALVVGAGDVPWQKWKKTLVGLTITVGACECILMPLVLVYPLTTVCYQQLQESVGLPPQVIEPMSHVEGWGEEIRDQIIEVRRRVQQQCGQAPKVLTHFHMLAGILAYGLRGECEVISIHAQAHQYDMWYKESDISEGPVLFVSSDAFLTSAGRAGQPEDYYRFEECTAQQDIEILRYGVSINRVHLWLCTGYQGSTDTPGPRI